MGELLVNLSDDSIKALVNNGYGMTENGVTASDGMIVFEMVYKNADIFPMFAIDFRDYLEENDIHIEEVKKIEMVAAAYDESGEELDFSEQYQKCAFVSEEALDGYSSSDILPQGNYKVIGSDCITKFDLTKYTGYSSDGTTLSASSLEEGAGINIQILNGDYTKLHCFVISSLKFIW